tara:strand:+ start:89 stop:364 length:276 start_codon:yes stop_codon:yes gene_type:complete
MSKINESMLTNLASVLTGAAIGKYLGNRLKSKKSTEKAAQKILSQNPELKKHAEDLKKSADKMKKSLDKVIDNLPPDKKKKFDDIQKQIYG